MESKPARDWGWLIAITILLAAARASLPRGADALATAIDHARASCGRAQHELAALGDRFADETGVHVTRDVRVEAGLSAAAAEAILRVAQEALANVRRHAGATAVTVTVETRAGETHLRIHDDGHGFDPQWPSPGMGLATMRERIGAVRGRLTVETGLGAGTTVAAVLPTCAE